MEHETVAMGEAGKKGKTAFINIFVDDFIRSNTKVIKKNQIYTLLLFQELNSQEVDH